MDGGDRVNKGGVSRIFWTVVLVVVPVWACLGAAPPPAPSPPAAPSQELFAAVRAGDQKAVRALLEGGADPTARDATGQTPLHVAAGVGDWQLVSALLAKGADPAARDDLGQSPLHLAALLGKTEAVVTLLRRGAAANPKDSAGLTPLHYAALQGRQEVAVALLDRGADPLAKDSTGRTAEALAREKGKSELALLLAEAARAEEERRILMGLSGTATRSYTDSDLAGAGQGARGYSPAGGAAGTNRGSGASGPSSYPASKDPQVAARITDLRLQLEALQERLDDLRSHPPEANTAYGVREGNLTTVYPSWEVRQSYDLTVQSLEEQIEAIEEQLDRLR